MVKLRHKGLLVIGLTRKELEALTNSIPIDIPLDDLSPSLKGQHIMLLVGEDNTQLKGVMETVANAYDNGATSPIQIARELPKGRRN